jgi:hypothetical protein
MSPLAKLVGLCLLLIPLETSASFAPLPLRTAVAQSDLVVVATLQKPKGSLWRRGAQTGTDYQGVLKVHRHLAGDLVKDHRCTLRWSVVKRMSGSVDYRYAMGKKGIWLLRRDKHGYTAGHPDCFRSMGDLATIERAVQEPLYLVDTRGWKDGGQACCITLEIRTFQKNLPVRDFISTKGGKIHLHGKAWLQVQGQMGKPLKPRADCLVKARAKPVVITRDKPHRVKVDLRRCFSLKRSFREVFHLQWGQSSKYRSPSYIFEL